MENNFPPWQIICHFVVTLFVSLSFQFPESSGPLPNGKFPGNLPTGRGPDDLAPNWKFPRNLPTGTKTNQTFFREVGPQAKLMPDLHTFASVILPNKLVPGPPEPSKVYLKGFLGNI